MAKKLLSEAAVRRFQRLANVAPINEMYSKRDDEIEEAMHAKRDDEVEEGMYGKRDDEVEEGMYKRDDEKAVHEEEGAEAPEMDMGGDKGGLDGDLELTDEEAQAIIDLGMKLKGAMGDEEPEMDLGDDADLGDEKEMMEADHDMEEDLMEALAGIDYVPSQGEIVNEVAQRVARRLKEAKLHEAKLNQTWKR